jgi:hypothetical protein
MAQYLNGVKDIRPLAFDDKDIHTKSPVYIVGPAAPTDFKLRIISRVKKAGLRYRSFDPQEQGRMSASEAINNVASSHGVIVPFLGANNPEAPVHNIRAAFVAGLAYGMEKEALLLQEGDEPQGQRINKLL